MSDELLRLSEVHRHYRARRALFARGSGSRVHAVNGIDLTLHSGQTLGIVGESGCGKSTLARLLVGLEQPSSGTVSWRGTDVATMSKAQKRAFHQKIQLVFQNPHGSLNPQLSVRDSVAEGLTTHKLVPASGIEKRITQLLDQVGLSSRYLDRHPHELSGGQLQRIGIARALAVEPHLLVCDEPVSALDISIQAQVLNLLNSLKQELNLAIVLIAHDLDVVQHMSDRIATMYLGKFVESGPCEQVYGAAGHPYTRALISATPRRGQDPRERIVLQGDPPSPVDLPKGCAFARRCYLARDICGEQTPPIVRLPDPVSISHPTASGSYDMHTSACHFAADVARSTAGSPAPTS